MTQLQRVEFEERDGQWHVTEVTVDGVWRDAEPFPASGHENFSKLEQVLRRMSDKYPEYRVQHTPYSKPNAVRYLLSIVPVESRK